MFGNKKKAMLAKEERLAGEMSTELVFVPQCTKCKHNLEIAVCAIFEDKPMVYMTNEKECPSKQPREPFSIKKSKEVVK